MGEREPDETALEFWVFAGHICEPSLAKLATLVCLSNQPNLARNKLSSLLSWQPTSSLPANIIVSCSISKGPFGQQKTENRKQKTASELIAGNIDNWFVHADHTFHWNPPASNSKRKNCEMRPQVNSNWNQTGQEGLVAHSAVAYLARLMQIRLAHVTWAPEHLYTCVPVYLCNCVPVCKC